MRERNDDVGRYWDESINFFCGCEKYSVGCNNCWALDMGRRFNWIENEGDMRWFDSMEGIQNQFKAAAGRNFKKVYFVQLLGDLFWSKVPDDIVRRVFLGIAETSRVYIERGFPDNQFLICTKRSKRFAKFFREIDSYHSIYRKQNGLDNDIWMDIKKRTWFGVSAENNRLLQKRAADLIRIRGIRRWISLEPLIERVDLASVFSLAVANNARIDGVVMGFESGAEARPGCGEWVERAALDCRAAGVPFYFKSWGKYLPTRVAIAKGMTVNFMNVRRGYVTREGSIQLCGRRPNRVAAHRLIDFLPFANTCLIRDVEDIRTRGLIQYNELAWAK